MQATYYIADNDNLLPGMFNDLVSDSSDIQNVIDLLEAFDLMYKDVESVAENALYTDGGNFIFQYDRALKITITVKTPLSCEIAWEEVDLRPYQDEIAEEIMQTSYADEHRLTAWDVL